MKAREEKDHDKAYAKAETVRQEQEEVSRKRFFNYMRGFQESNDMKTKQFSNYLGSKDIHQLSALDEARYLKAQQEYQIKDRKKADQKEMKYNNAQL